DPTVADHHVVRAAPERHAPTLSPETVMRLDYSMSETSAQIRERLGHPVIDIDGHMAEYFPVLAPYLEREGLSLDHPTLRRLLPAYGGTDKTWHEQTPEERAATRTPRGPWWSSPAAKTIDLATALFPQLLHER